MPTPGIQLSSGKFSNKPSLHGLGLDRRSFKVLYHDFANIGAIPDLTTFSSGSGSAAIAGAAESGHPGVVQLETGTTTSGVGGVKGLDYCVPGSGIITFETMVKIPTLSNGTQEFEVYFGIWDGGNTALTSGALNYVLFIYGSNINSGEWQGKCNNASTQSSLDTNVAATTGWTKLKWVINAAASSIEFFVNDVSKGTLTTTIPSGVALTPVMRIRKTAGSTERTVLVDYVYLSQEVSR